VDEIWRFDKVDFSKHGKKFVQDWYNRGFAARTLYEKDMCANMAVFITPVIAEGATKDFYLREKRNRVIGMSALADSLEGAGGDGANREDWFGCNNYSQDAAKDCYFVPDSYKDAPDNLLDSRLYAKLREISEESAILRMIVAWYIYNNGYLEALSEEQAEFWETDFTLIDLLDADDRCQVNWLVSYINIDTVTFYKYRAYIQEHLSGFYNAVLHANA
jgi:hypothetical protein